MTPPLTMARKDRSTFLVSRFGGHATALTLWVRALLLTYSILLMCPIRFWPIESSLDNTWVFALNWAAAHGLKAGRDIFWTTGPWGYLTAPQDFGSNLTAALTFQAALWLVLIAALTDFYLVSRFPVLNLCGFAVLLGLASPLYWFNYVGLENLLFTAVLLLLCTCRWRGGRLRWYAALILCGCIGLIKFTACVLALGAAAGFLADRLWRDRSKAAGDVVAVLILPPVAFQVGASLALGSLPTRQFFAATLELTTGYSAAMSTKPPTANLLLCAETFLLIGLLLLWLRHSRTDHAARFYALLLAIPLWVSAKHAFVRADAVHVVNFFCFAALAIGLIMLHLGVPSDRRGLVRIGAVLAIFVGLWQGAILRAMPLYRALTIVSGARSIEFLGKSVRGVEFLRSDLGATSEGAEFENRIEPELRAEIGDADVASLSNGYNWAAAEHLSLKVMPIPQRYSAYGPYLDRLNAEWIRDHGPRFLIWDGQAIDNRNVIAETPAEWTEVYRWYGLKRVGPRNMLLERRRLPRQMILQPLGGARGRLNRGLELPEIPGPVFLAMRCPLTTAGKIRYLVGGIPELRMSLAGAQGNASRILPSVMETPALVNYSPQSLQQLAKLFEDGNEMLPWLTSRLNFEGPGMTSYGPTCSYELYRLSAESAQQ